MEQINTLESLPNEILGEALSRLSNNDLLIICGSVSKRIQNVCKKEIIPSRIRQIGGGKKISLPYDEPDPFKKLIMAESIYGSSLIGANLVNPDYAVFMGMKFDNRVVVEKYTGYTTEFFSEGYDRITGKAGNYAYVNNLTDDNINLLFDQPRDTAYYQRLVKTLINNFGRKFNEIRYLSPLIIKNIVTYGQGFYGPNVIESLKPFVNKNITEAEYDALTIIPVWYRDTTKYINLLRFYDPKNPLPFLLNHPNVGLGISFDHMPADLFERYLKSRQTLELERVIKAIWGWNRWDLWDILLKYQDPSSADVTKLINNQSFPGHISTYSLSIIYKLFPNVFSDMFENKTVLKNRGYLPLIKFCNRMDLPIPKGAVAGNTLDLLFQNSFYYNKIKSLPATEDQSYVKSIREPFHYGSEFLEQQFNTVIKLPANYYISKTTFGKLLQLASESPFQINRTVYVGDKTVGALNDYKSQSVNNLTIKTSIETGEYINIEKAIVSDMTSYSANSDVIQALKIIGPTLYNANPNIISEYLGKDNLTFKFLVSIKNMDAVKVINDIDKDGYIKAIKQIFGYNKESALLFRPVLAKSFLDNNQTDYTMFRLLYPVTIPDQEAEILLDTFIRSFDKKKVIREDVSLELFDMFSRNTIEKLIPGMISYYMTKTQNPLGIFYKWLQQRAPYKLNTAWAVKYYDIVCLYGLHFLIRVCTLDSIRAALKEIISTPYIPKSVKDSAIFYLD